MFCVNFDIIVLCGESFRLKAWKWEGKVKMKKINIRIFVYGIFHFERYRIVCFLRYHIMKTNIDSSILLWKRKQFSPHPHFLDFSLEFSHLHFNFVFPFSHKKRSFVFKCYIVEYSIFSRTKATKYAENENKIYDEKSI